MNQARKLLAVKNALGEPEGFNQRKGEYVFRCPIPSCTGKPKLSVNIEAEIFNCWVCGFKGRSLARILRLSPVRADLREYLEEGPGLITHATNVEVLQPPELPREYVPIVSMGTKNPFYRYLESRGIGIEECFRYKIGAADTGNFRGRVIFPSFDSVGNLNFFSARSIHETKWRYMTPQSSKNIIFYESMVDWSKPIVLVEGVFDAIATSENAIPISGRIPSPLLIERIVREGSEVTVALDNDAFKTSLSITNRLMKLGVVTKFLKLPDKDPAEMGNKMMTECLKNGVLIDSELKMLQMRSQLIK